MAADMTGLQYSKSQVLALFPDLCNVFARVFVPLYSHVESPLALQIALHATVLVALLLL